MDTATYIDRIEANVDDPDALGDLQRQATTDSGLDEHDKGLILGRIGTYLADHQRSQGPDHEPDWSGE